MGVQQTFGGMARVVFPVMGGFLFDRVVELPFLFGGALVLATLVMAWGVETEEAKPA